MNQTVPAATRADRSIALALGLTALVIYLATSALRFHSIDEIAIFSVARSVASRGSFDADILYWTKAALGNAGVVAIGADGHAYATKDIAPAILIVPLVWLGYRLPISPVRTALLLSPLITAVTVSLMYGVARTWGYRRKVAAMGAFTLAFASMAWPYAETLFTQPLAALGLLIALQGTVCTGEGRGWQAALLGGLGLGLAGLSAIPTWISLPVYVLYLVPWHALSDTLTWDRVKLYAGFIVGAGICAVVQGFYNAARFGSPIETGYQQIGALNVRLSNLGLGLFGQLFSTPRGLIWYAPFVLLIPFGLWIGWRTAQRSRLGLTASQAVIIFLLYSAYGTWWGGVNWGPRFLVAIMPALVLLLMPLMDRLSSATLWERLAGSAVLLISCLTQLLAALFDSVQSDVPFAAALDAISPPASLIVRAPVLASLDALPVVRQIAAARAGAWDVLWMSEGRLDSLLLGMLIIAGLASILTLSAALRESPSIRIGPGISGGLAVSVIVMMLARYPEGPDAVASMDRITQTVDQITQPGDGVVALLPASGFDWINRSPGKVHDIGIVFEDALSGETAALLAQTGRWHRRIWLVSEGTTGANPANGVEHWLADHAFIGSETWLDGFRIVPYTYASAEADPFAVNQPFGDGPILLEGASVETVAPAQDHAGWINVWLKWSAAEPPTQDYTVFVQALDSAGMLVGQHDGAPGAGYSPTSTWQPNTPIEDRHSILLPAGLPSGEYQLLVGLYDPPTGARLPLANRDGDALLLQTLALR